MAVRRTRTLLGAIGAAASFLVAATGTAAADPPTPAPACTMTVAFVAGADPAPTGDASLRSAVNSAAGDPSCVTTVLDSAATGWFLDTFGIVVVSSSVHLDRLPADLTATTRPVVVSEPYLFDDFGLTAGPGSETTGTTVAVRAGKLTGRTTTATAPVLTTAGPVNVARPLAGATIGATLPGAPIRVALFGSYDDARANRVGLFAGYGAVLTATGRDLVHAALDWAYNRLPRHDDFADAVTVTGPSGSRTVDHSGATLQPGEPAPADGRDRSIWYRCTAPANGTLDLWTQGSSYDTLLAVYSGSAVGSLTALAANDDYPGAGLSSRVSLAVASGTTYRIAVDGYGRQAGAVNIAGAFAQISDPDPPPPPPDPDPEDPTDPGPDLPDGVMSPVSANFTLVARGVLGEMACALPEGAVESNDCDALVRLRTTAGASRRSVTMDVGSSRVVSLPLTPRMRRQLVRLGRVQAELTVITVEGRESYDVTLMTARAAAQRKRALAASLG